MNPSSTGSRGYPAPTAITRITTRGGGRFANRPYIFPAFRLPTSPPLHGVAWLQTAQVAVVTEKEPVPFGPSSAIPPFDSQRSVHGEDRAPYLRIPASLPRPSDCDLRGAFCRPRDPAHDPCRPRPCHRQGCCCARRRLSCPRRPPDHRAHAPSSVLHLYPQLPRAGSCGTGRVRPPQRAL